MWLQEELHTQQAFYWQHYRANRIKEAAEAAGGSSEQPGSAQQHVDAMVS